MRFKDLLRQQSGFSLLEMLIAISLMAIITMTISQFISTSFRANALATRYSNDVRHAQKVLELISDEIRYGSGFQISLDAQTLTYTDSDGNLGSTITAVGDNLQITHGGSSPRSYPLDGLTSLQFNFSDNINTIQVQLALTDSSFTTMVHGVNATE